MICKIIYRKLQKENVPFAAGVLYTNDIDYQLARILAMETVTEAPFQEIGDEAFARACELMKSCERVMKDSAVKMTGNVLTMR